MSTSKKIHADILFVSFNHAQFAGRALAGILEQKHSLCLRIILADDCSTDGTADLIRSGMANQPYELIFRQRSQNIGMLKNYEDAFSMVEGEYIFILEGDDYWVDPHRLQKHVDFMEDHPDCVMTMNRFTEYNEGKGEFYLPDWPYPDDHAFITTNLLAGGNRLGNLSACCIRTSAWRKINKGIFEIPVADWMIGMAIGEYGKIALLKEPMSVYRKSETGLWSGMGAEKQKSYLLELIKTYDQYLGYRYHLEFEGYRQAILGPVADKKARSFTDRILSGLGLLKNA